MAEEADFFIKGFEFGLFGFMLCILSFHPWLERGVVLWNIG